MIKHKNHIIDSRAKISENFNEFLRSSVKSFKIKVLHPMRRSIRMLSIPGIMRIFPGGSIQKQSPGGVL